MYEPLRLQFELTRIARLINARNHAESASVRIHDQAGEVFVVLTASRDDRHAQVMEHVERWYASALTARQMAYEMIDRALQEIEKSFGMPIGDIPRQVSVSESNRA